MSFAALSRCCGTRGFVRRLPNVNVSKESGISATAPATKAPRRFMGGGGGGQPISRSMEAELWQGHPKEPEGWETTVQITYAATVVIFALMGFAPDTSIKTWASGEARARLELQAAGKLEKPVFGVHYNDIMLPTSQKFDFESESPDNPFNEDDDDDDDEDDDDDDEEDDEEDEEENEDEEEDKNDSEDDG